MDRRGRLVFVGLALVVVALVLAAGYTPDATFEASCGTVLSPSAGNRSGCDEALETPRLLALLLGAGGVLTLAYAALSSQPEEAEEAEEAEDSYTPGR